MYSGFYRRWQSGYVKERGRFFRCTQIGKSVQSVPLLPFSIISLFSARREGVRFRRRFLGFTSFFFLKFIFPWRSFSKLRLLRNNFPYRWSGYGWRRKVGRYFVPFRFLLNGCKTVAGVRKRKRLPTFVNVDGSFFLRRRRFPLWFTILRMRQMADRQRILSSYLMQGRLGLFKGSNVFAARSPKIGRVLNNFTILKSRIIAAIRALRLRRVIAKSGLVGRGGVALVGLPEKKKFFRWRRRFGLVVVRIMRAVHRAFFREVFRGLNPAPFRGISPAWLRYSSWFLMRLRRVGARESLKWFWFMSVDLLFYAGWQRTTFLRERLLAGFFPLCYRVARVRHFYFSLFSTSGRRGGRWLKRRVWNNFLFRRGWRPLPKQLYRSQYRGFLRALRARRATPRYFSFGRLFLHVKTKSVFLFLRQRFERVYRGAGSNSLSAKATLLFFKRISIYFLRKWARYLSASSVFYRYSYSRFLSSALYEIRLRKRMLLQFVRPLRRLRRRRLRFFLSRGRARLSVVIKKRLRRRAVLGFNRRLNSQFKRGLLLLNSSRLSGGVSLWKHKVLFRGRTPYRIWSWDGRSYVRSARINAAFFFEPLRLSYFHYYNKVFWRSMLTDLFVYNRGLSA